LGSEVVYWWGVERCEEETMRRNKGSCYSFWVWINNKPICVSGKWSLCCSIKGATNTGPVSVTCVLVYDPVLFVVVWNIHLVKISLN
jgi:hypothetical protein